MNLIIVIVLAVLGVVLLVLEVFLFPGVGIGAFGGVLCSAGAIVYAYWTVGVLAGHLTLLAILIACLALIIAFMHTNSIDKMELKTEIDDHVQLADPGKKINKLKRDADKLEAEQQEEEPETKRIQQPQN